MAPIKCSIAACFISALLVATTSAAETHVVTSAADAGGSCPGASCTLRQAIATAATGDTILFNTGITTVTLTTAELRINKNLTISGPGANLLAVQRSSTGGTPFFRIFDIPAGFNVTLSGLTVANGAVIGTANNHEGGGIFNAGTLIIAGCAVSGNSTLANGPGNRGGGIASTGTLTITDSTISGNTSKSNTDGGGGIYNTGTLAISNSTIAGNSADDSTPGGGGILNAGTLTITNSTVSGNNVRNSAAGGGGGILNTAGTATITNSTITGNLAQTGTGGGVRRTGGTVNVRNTILAMNTAPTAPDFGGTLVSNGYNLIGSTSGTTITNITTGNQLNVDPKLDPLSDNGGPTFTHALKSGSPAIEAGNSFGFNTDQRGFARPVVSPITMSPVGDGSDIGAYEVQADVLPGCNTINRIVTNKNDSGPDSLRDVISKVCAGSTITFAPSITGAINLSGSELAISKTLTINGPGANLLSVQRDPAAAASTAFRIFNISPAGVIASISGLTIANGLVAGSGGGISNTGSLNLSNVAISGNRATNGGGIFNFGAGTLRIFSSTIAGNTVNSTVVAGSGGGIFNSGGVVSIADSTISGNSAVGPGGSSDSGGGIITNVGKVTIVNSTITGNSADFGGGVRNVNGGTVIAKNTLIALNTSASGPDVNGPLTSQGFNLIGNIAGSTIAPVQFSDQLGVTAAQLKLDALRNNGGPTQTHALLNGSVAIDKGNAGGSITDQRGSARPFDMANIANDTNGGDGADIGAVEVRIAHLDVDGNNDTDALTDGVLVIRYLLGLGGVALTNGAVGSMPTRGTPVTIIQYLDGIRPVLDVDGNGEWDAATDGLLLIRYLFGLRSTSLTTGSIGSGATRTQSQIETHIQSLMP